MVDSRSADDSFETKADAPAAKNAWLAFGSSITVNMRALRANPTIAAPKGAASISCKHSPLPPHCHDDVRPGPAGEDGPGVVDNLSLCRADKPDGADDDLDDVYGCPGALVQFYTEVAGERIDNHVAAVERLQHEYLSDYRCRLAGCHTAGQHARQRRATQPVTDPGHLTQ